MFDAGVVGCVAPPESWWQNARVGEVFFLFLFLFDKWN